MKSCMYMGVEEHTSRFTIRKVDIGIHSEIDVQRILVSIVVSIPACHAGDRGSIHRRGDTFLY